MSRLDDILPQPMSNSLAKEVGRQKQDIKDLVLELIGETNSFQSENTGRVWIDPDHLIQKVNEL